MDVLHVELHEAVLEREPTDVTGETGGAFRHPFFTFPLLTKNTL